jgi:ferredoxin
MSLEIEVSRARCIATKACINAAGGVFALVDGASSVVNPVGASVDDVVRAAEACPVGAIRVFKDGQRLA